MNGPDRLKADITSFIAHVKSLPPNPTREQLQTKVKTLCSTIKNDSRTAPLEVKTIIKAGFEVVGWDAVNMKISNESLFTAGHLLSGLEQIKDALNGWTPSVIPTAEELASISLACKRLWEIDVHRLVPDKDYAIDLQASL